MKTNSETNAAIRPLRGWLGKLTVMSLMALTLLLTGGQALAVQLVGWEMQGLIGGSGIYGPSPYAPAFTAANVTIGPLTRGPGVSTGGTGANNAWGGSAWTDASEAAAIASGKYATFSITANAGYKVSITGVPAYNIRRSGTGPATGIWQYQVGNGAFTDIGSPITWGSTTTASGNPQAAIDLSGFPDLQNVPPGTTVTFRVTTWGGGAQGTWYINSTGAGYDLQLEGSVDPADIVPPAPVATDASAVTSATFAANWNAASGATGYQLDVATDAGFSSFVPGFNNLDVGNVTSYVITGLAPSTTYYYRVRAYNATGTSDNSNIETVTTLGAVAATQMTVTLPGEAFANAGTATPQMAGTPFNVTLTAVMSDGTTVDTGYSGTRTITFSGPTGSPVYPGTVNFSGGVGIASVTLSKAETTTLSATDGLLAGIASSSLVVNPATYVWTVTSGSANWADAASWTPSRVAPGTDDTLVFGQGGDSIALGVPAGTIAGLVISNNTAITLQAAGAGTLEIAGGFNAFSIETGSTLNVGTGGALTISLPTATSGSISGAVDFAGGAHRLLAADANGLTFQSGGTFTADTGFTGNAFGTANLGSVIFAAGSTYVQKAGANPFGASQPSSVVVFQTGSLYRVEANTAPAFSGRTYGDLEINAATFNVSSTGNSPLTLDNLTITAGTLNLNLNGGVNIKGNVSVTGGTLGFSPDAGNVTFSGTSTQTVSGPGPISFGAGATVGVAAGATVLLQTPVSLALALNVDGTLGGTGSVTGAGLVTISPSGTLAPGASIGALTFDTAPALGGTTLLEVDRGASPNADEVVTASPLIYAGTLTVENIGAPLAAGDTFTLFSAAGLGGAFAPLNLPALGAGLAWDTTDLAVGGTIKVVSTGTVVPPTISSLTITGGNLILSGTNNAGAGGTFSVLTSTDAAAPLSSWTVLTTGTFDGSGTFSVTNAIGSDARRFFRLQVP